MQNRVMRSSGSREPRTTGNERFALFIFLGSYALIFVTLAIVVVNLHNISIEWPPPGVQPLSLWKGELVTLVLLASSLTLHLALRVGRQGDSAGFNRLMLVTLALGLLFLAGQIYQFATAGMTIQSGVYGAVFFTMAGFHALHIILGLALLTRLLDRLHGTPLSAELLRTTPAAAIVWHFLDLMWLPFFIVLYLL